MIEQLDRSLERWLRAALPLPPGTGELQFDQPEGSWDARRPTPLVNLYLYSLRRSATRAAAGARTVVLDDGGLARERVIPVVEARYLLSVWGGSAGVEHELLGRVMHLLAQREAIPDEHLSDALRAVRPRPTVSIYPDTDTSITALWSGLDVPPRPSLQLAVYSPLGLSTPTAAAPAPSSVHLSFERATRPAAFLPRRRVLSRPADAEPARPRVVISDPARSTAAVIDPVAARDDRDAGV